MLRPVGMRWTAVVGGVAATLSLTACGSAQPGAAPFHLDPAPTAASSPSCRVLVPVTTTYRDAAGRVYDEPAPDRAKVEQFRDAGTVWDEITPPAGFRPTEATDAELAAFGFAPRPASGPARQDWDATFANYRGVAPAADERRCAPSSDIRFGGSASQR